MKSFASFRYYYFYFAWKCEAGSWFCIQGPASYPMRWDFL